ncbi:HD domain-containing protein [Arsenophonus endosymbiont of Bemisia tabaci]|uniref:HD domain-containing protein n=1 Tax=Arsenophonus endosymbiont of Bemisia tabaci TaxID=536059 RepID=UPI001770CF92|nr:HD domain-containing protein [Arsenophonus endosymbiont of Bemisia tabaci]CAA2929640.1 Bifunctional uridylyltransferase/uridylyl-removing enzyme [Arsenophonus endosymbiont of Bemisia tabaci Q2]
MEKNIYFVIKIKTLSYNSHQHPLCVAIYSKLAQPEILRLAAMFHDITKGRKSDHSELGAEDAKQFALEHGPI